NSAETIGKPAARASENRPTASPTEMPIAVPTTQPAPIRISDIEMCAHSSPDAASAQSARTMPSGAGKNSALTRPSEPAACQSASTRANVSQEVSPRGAGAKPVARKRTFCPVGTRTAGVSGRSIETLSRIGDFPLGGKRAFANQRPQSGVRRAELRLEGGRAALAARNRDRDDVLDLSRAP